ncbi:MAG: 2-hydroxyacyl-CoA dehydratase [Firmicutes bacterium]|nr:2-hydroxyacyl-CoA dehydratase [Candidatus Fermentithermobacillaceae bacterium]
MLLSTCSYIPLEIPLSLGIPAKRLFLRDIASGAESYVPRDFCPYAKGVLGYVAECARGSRRVSLAVAGSCDAMRRIADLVRVYWKDVTLYYVDVPRTSTDYAVHYYASVLKEFSLKLACEASDRNSRGLAETIRIMNRLRREMGGLFREARDSSQGRPWSRAIDRLLGANEFLASGAVFDFAKPLELSAPPQYSRGVTREEMPGSGETRSSGKESSGVGIVGGKELPRSDEAESRRAWRPSVIVTGSLCLDRTLIWTIEEAGFKIAALDSCLGERSVNFQIDENDPDCFHALAEGYLRKPPCPRMLDYGRRMAYLDEMVRGVGPLMGDGVPDGLIYFVPKFCDQGYYDYVEVKRHLEGSFAPVLLLEGEFGVGNSAQAKTRLAAFREMLEMRKTHRSKPGVDRKGWAVRSGS